MFKNNSSHVIKQICHLLPNTSTVDFCHILSSLKKHEFTPANNPMCTKQLVFLRAGQVQTYNKIGVRLFFTNLRMSFVFLSLKIKIVVIFPCLRNKKMSVF